MIQPETFQLSFDELAITAENIQQLIGYTQPESCPEPVVHMVKEILHRAPGLCDIKGGYILTEKVQADVKNRVLYCHEEIFHTGKVVTNQLKNSEMAAWCICTAGENLPAYARELMNSGDFMEGYVADVAGNIIVESAMDIIAEHIKAKMVERGLKTTNRYSPGYCDWDITEQKKLFALFPEEYLGVRLTDSCLMQPIKTVSGVIGIGKNVKSNPYSCHFCTQQNCLYRNKKIKTGK